MVLENITLQSLDRAAALILDAYPGHNFFICKGAMGAGKTTLIKSFCKALGVEQNVSSPTFSLVNEYVSASGQIVYHFDFYRIKRISEVYDIGYEEYFYSGHYCFLEWPEMVSELLPEEYVEIQIEAINLERTIFARLISANRNKDESL